MISCLVCLTSLEMSLESSVCLSSCGHVFHSSCIFRWCETHSTKTCPKCRLPIPDSSSFIKLYFGTGETTETSDTVRELLNENDMCRRKIEMMMREVGNILNVIDKNTREIASLVTEDAHHKIEKEDVTEIQPFTLKTVAVMLSRTDELKRMQDYYDSLNN